VNKITQLLKSRKFWATIATLVTTWVAAYSKAITIPDTINATVAAVAAYCIATGIEATGQPTQ
jgi:hypothetical protein